MTLVKGPFNIKWGANTLLDVSEMALNFSQSSNSYTTVAGQTYTVDGAIDASVTLKFLISDVAALAVALPQYHVAMGKTLSSGETVSDPDGAIDLLAASCNTNPVYNDLDIIACGVNSQVFRLKTARTVVDSMDFANNDTRTVSVKFIGEPAQGIANIQFFKSGTISTIS